MKKLLFLLLFCVVARCTSAQWNKNIYDNGIISNDTIYLQTVSFQNHFNNGDTILCHVYGYTVSDSEEFAYCKFDSVNNLFTIDSVLVNYYGTHSSVNFPSDTGVAYVTVEYWYNYLGLLFPSGGGTPGWNLTGNSGTTSSNFIGTISNQPLILKAHNSPFVTFDPTVGSYGTLSIGYGGSAIAYQDGDVAIGSGGTSANGIESFAEGYAASTTGVASTAIGDNVTANGNDAVALGDYTTAQGNHSFASGENIKVGLNSFGFSSAVLGHPGNSSYTLDISALSNIACFNDVDVLITNNSNTQGSLKFYARNSSMTLSGAHQTSFKAPNSLSADVNYILPSSQGAANTMLTNNGSGTLSWTTVSSRYATETPSGTQNGINTIFTLSHTPVSDTTTDMQGSSNGSILYPFSNYGSPDYVMAGTTITFTVAPAPGDKLLFRYRY